MQVDVRTANLGSPDAATLVAALNDEIQARYPTPLDAFYFSLDEDEVGPGRGAFALAWVDGRAVGCGAVRLIEGDTAELKRMYVVPGSRRHGRSRSAVAVLGARGGRPWSVPHGVGDRHDPAHAVAVYRRAGYEQIPRFGPYVDSAISYCMAKSLVELRWSLRSTTPARRSSGGGGSG